MRERLTRIRGGVALGVTLVGQRLRRTAPRRVVYSVLGVALAVGLFVLVASVGVGLTAQGSVVDSDADYWIVPESESSATLPVSVGGPQLGSVHGVADRLSDRDDVRYASPVAVSLTEVARANATEYVLVIGVIAHSDLTVGGVHAGPLTPGDTHRLGADRPPGRPV
jgi:putative ABC transport system permease protein